MAYNTKQIKTDANGKPVPQYYNKDMDDFEVLEGQKGASKVIAYDSYGNESNVTVAIQPILDKLSQLTGTVIDEETRKSNEQLRVTLYDLISRKLADGEFKGEKGDRGPQGIQGPPGKDGSDANVTKENVINAIGYTPANEVELDSKMDKNITELTLGNYKLIYNSTVDSLDIEVIA